MLGRVQFPVRSEPEYYFSTKLKKDVEIKFSISPNAEDHPDSFFKAIRPIIVLAQFFGLLVNIHGTTGKNYTHLYFKLKSWRTIYTLLLMTGTLFLLVCTVKNTIHDGVSFDSSSALVFYSIGLVTTTIFIMISVNWPDICREFFILELKFCNYGYPRRLGLKLKLLTLVFLVGAIVEHSLSYILSLEYVLSEKTSYHHHHHLNSLIERVFCHHYNQVTRIFDYANWKMVLVVYVNLVSTFWWSYNDLFLSIISICITSKIRQFNNAMFRYIGQVKPSKYWTRARENYNSLSLLTKKIDGYIRILMFASLGSNLYFICLQLFRSLRNDLNAFNGVALIYFNWSFGFLLFRTVSVAISAANLHEASKEVKEVVYSIPKEGYSEEVERLLIQIHNDDIVLTGWKFFSITKKFMLKIAGTIMTYEIFCVQLIPINEEKS